MNYQIIKFSWNFSIKKGQLRNSEDKAVCGRTIIRMVGFQQKKILHLISFFYEATDLLNVNGLKYSVN